MERAGRNDPCPCGSGKKYKKCCYDKDTQGGSPQRAAQAHAPKALDQHKFKVVGAKKAETQPANLFTGTMEKQQELDAEALDRGTDRESQELLCSFDKVDYRRIPSIAPVKRLHSEEAHNAFSGSRHDTE